MSQTGRNNSFDGTPAVGRDWVITGERAQATLDRAGAEVPGENTGGTQGLRRSALQSCRTTATLPCGI